MSFAGGPSVTIKSHDDASRHPFPGPGLAIRVPGAITRDKLGDLSPAISSKNESDSSQCERHSYDRFEAGRQ